MSKGRRRAAAPLQGAQVPIRFAMRLVDNLCRPSLLQIDQTVEPTKVTISGTPHSLSLAVSMVTDIVKGTFKGFALLRQITNPGGGRPAPVGNPMAQPRPVYAPGYGLIPPSQVSRRAWAWRPPLWASNALVLYSGPPTGLRGVFVEYSGISGVVASC